MIGLALFFIQSCSEDAKALEDDAQLSQTELRTILETDEISGVADNALAELFANNSISGKSINTNECYTAEYSETGFVATFNNCVLNGTDNVNGTLTVTYEMSNETISYIAAYEDFYVGTIKINGTRSFTINGDLNQNMISFSVTSAIEVEMEDESIITENGTKTFGFSFSEDLENTQFTIAGNWTVVYDGNTYSIETVNDLQGSLTCEYLTTGSMIVEKNGLEITVDFGDGECDDQATVIYPNGATEEITL
ncbi:hypothetical protein DX873_05305 [Flagellimonas nanhaiensis]|uniref:Uncharacterized protein n=2 Tax=Flagellimonas nanhaiensis TaxID=2292706 RepID=A0A371JUW6_9FLAO|nr:hypothetical protein DX873_05305 [Allomuricauda nanhaiensis]